MPNAMNDLFAVSQAEIAAAYPSSQEAVDLMIGANEEIEQRRSKIRYEPSDEATSAETVDPTKATRRDIRSLRPNIATMNNMRLAGAQYASRFATNTEAERALKAAVFEGTNFNIDDIPDELLPFEDIAGSEADFVRKMRALGEQAKGEVTESTSSGTRSSYALLRMLATDIGTEIRNERPRERYRDWRPNHMLARLILLGGEPTQQTLATKTRQGQFDAHIADDLLRIADTTESQHPDIARIRGLSRLALAAANKSEHGDEFRAHLASLADIWTPGERQVIVGVRELLIGGMAVNFTLAQQRLEDAFYFEENTDEMFRRSYDTFMKDMIKHWEGMITSPQLRIQFTQLKAQVGRRRPNAKQRRAAAEAQQAETAAATKEVETNEPPILATCDLTDGTTVEGIDEIKANFIENASQGNVTVPQDVEKIFDFMVRTDLPSTHRRGVKIIREVGVRMGEKIHPLWEFKPLEAAGLSLRTNVAKNSRVYFVKLPDNVWGIVGFEPRARQDEFLKSVRVKIKRGKQDLADVPDTTL